MNGYQECTAGLNYHLPYEEVPDGPIRFEGIEGFMAGELTIAAGFIDAPIGRLPILRYNFTGPGAVPMSRHSLEPIVLVLDANGMRTVKQLTSAAVDSAILRARRGK